MYLLAIIFPPAAVLMCGKPFQAFIAFLLLPFIWIPSVLYAWAIVAEKNAERRNDKLIGAIQGNRSRSLARRSEPDEPADNQNPFAF